MARPLTGAPLARLRVAVVGGGWAGLAAAVEATRRGAQVTLFEMAPQLGGRARSLGPDAAALDNGQHILIGAYVETLALLASLGVDERSAFVRRPLALVHGDGTGLRLAAGAPVSAFARAVLRPWGPPLRDRLSLVAASAGWALAGFRCPAGWTVSRLAERLSPRLRRDLIDPLCVAALNTPADTASAAVFLRVLKDALFSGPGSADLLLPRVGLSELLPQAAAGMLADAGGVLRCRQRVGRIDPRIDGWQLDGETFDRVVLAAPAPEAARLARPCAPAWAEAAGSLRHEPIVTVYLQARTVRLAEPMLAIRTEGGDDGPAQFVVDRGALGGPPGLLAFVVSGAAGWVARGADEIERAVVLQARALLPDGTVPVVVRTVTEKRATFACTPGLRRPTMRIAPALHAAGDHVAGPYPATLEGAVRSGLQAVRAFAPAT